MSQPILEQTKKETKMKTQKNSKTKKTTMENTIQNKNKELLTTKSGITVNSCMNPSFASLFLILVTVGCDVPKTFELPVAPAGTLDQFYKKAHLVLLHL
jgi:hypothetical protein